MKEAEIKLFEKTQVQLESLHSEISKLNTKSQNDALNKFKLKFVNTSIREANEILGEQYRPFTDFREFSEDDLPTNSDVTMILGQYLNCMENLRADNIKRMQNNVDFKFIGYDWYWIAEEKQTAIKTSAPKKLNSK